jgi:ACS family glucarate transporter-like MFS transporter
MSNFVTMKNSRPTWCRWGVVALATMMSTMLYLDRFCWSFAKTFIQEDVGITSAQADYCLSCFFWAYALAQIPSGWLSDRWGPRIMLSCYIFTWSVFTILIGWSASLIMLMAMQLGHGLCQAGAYPTSASMLSRWMPITTRGTASSFVAFGGRFGGFIAPILTGWLIVAFVPVEHSSLLTPKTILTGGLGQFSLNLENEGRSESPVLNPSTGPVGSTSSIPATGSQASNAKIPNPELLQRINDILPNSMSTQFREIAAREIQRRQQFDSASTAAEKAVHSKLEFSSQQIETVAEGLNQVLRDRHLVTAEIAQRLNLDLEAKTLLKQLTSGESLSQSQFERVNRLVLEKAFPALIGKVYVNGWRRVYIVYGIAGIIVALLCYILIRNRPEEHPACNVAEVELIRDGLPATASTLGKQPPLPWGKILRSWSLWLSSLSQVGTNIGWLFVTTKLPEYLETVHHVEISRRGTLSSWPMAAGIAGMLLGGRLTDWLRVKLGLRWGRAIPLGVTKIGAAAAYIACIFAEDATTVALLCAAVAFFTDLSVAPTWAFVQDAGGRYVGVVLGFGNMWGNIGAAVAPIIYSASIDSTRHLAWSKDGWNTCFILCATAMILSGIAGILIDATKPIFGDDAAESADLDTTG